MFLISSTQEGAWHDSRQENFCMGAVFGRHNLFVLENVCFARFLSGADVFPLDDFHYGMLISFRTATFRRRDSEEKESVKCTPHGKPRGIFYSEISWCVRQML